MSVNGTVGQSDNGNEEASRKGAEAQSVELDGISREFALRVHSDWRNSVAAASRSDLEALAMILIQKRSVDGYAGRRWDSTAHLYFSSAVDSMLEKIKLPEVGK